MYHYQLITKIIINNDNEYVNDLLLSFLPTDENNMCSICLTTEPKELLINLCSCKTPCHVHCLIQLSKHKPLNKCVVCQDKYIINEPFHRKKGLINKPDIDTDVFFPHHDFYYEPLLNRQYPVKFTGMSCLTMAIMYLQIKRVEELLQEPEILDNLENYYFGYEPYKQTPIIALCSGNIPSNCHISYGDNLRKYMTIILLLLKTNKIDLSVKDAFGKTYKDYIDENKLNILDYVFKLDLLKNK
jgi:hypothetical protein